MAEKTLNTRIQQKHDIEANWLKAVNFIPKVGEVIVYDIDETHTTPRMKIGDGVKNINELEFIGEKAATSNWNASEGEPGYIENRTHYAELGEILLETNIVVSEDFGQGEVTTSISLEVGKTYIVTLNNTQYTCTAWQVSNAPVVVLGNGLMVGEEAYGSNEPFAIGIVPKDNETNALVLITNPGEYSIKIATESIYHKLDYKYIPNSDWSARVDEPGHILNRTHWEEKEIGVALEEVSIPYNIYNNCFYITDEFNFFPLEGTAYITFNGERYETKCTYSDDDAEGVTSFDIGNKFLRHDDEENTGEPFFIHILYYANSGYNSMNCYLIANSDITDTITLKVEGIKTHNIKQLDPIFLPNSVLTENDMTAITNAEIDVLFQ